MMERDAKTEDHKLILKGYLSTTIYPIVEIPLSKYHSRRIENNYFIVTQQDQCSY